MCFLRQAFGVAILISSSVGFAAGFDHEHRVFTQLLAKYVVPVGKNATAVNYKAWKANAADQQVFRKYLDSLSAIPEATYNSWKREFKMAFMINAYNAFTLELILKHYPVGSIKDIGGVFTKPWSIEFFSLLGKKRTLDWIEHDELRPKFNDPRVHFAVNCASIGCPALARQAFVANKLDEQLDVMTKIFLADNSRNRYVAKENKIYISKIFDWFEEDWVKTHGSVSKFLAKYFTTTDEVKQNLAAGKVTIDHLEYDWNLNEKK